MFHNLLLSEVERDRSVINSRNNKFRYILTNINSYYYLIIFTITNLAS